MRKITNIIISIMLSIISIILILFINYNLFTNEYYTENHNEEICKMWRNWKNKPYDKEYIFDPYKLDFTILKNSSRYYEIDNNCEQYEPIRSPYKDKNIPDYLRVLYKLLNNNNVVKQSICTEKYIREDQFGNWRNIIKCNTRSHVLYDENKADYIKFFPNECDLDNSCTSKDYNCSIMEGKWIPYTGDYISLSEKPYTNSNDLQIDHTVPLQNAWINGACNWSKELRIVYTNDRTPGHLSIMVKYLNTDKKENTPYKWLPPINKERYISNWIAVKYRYNLKLSIYEFNTLHKLLETYKIFIPDKLIDENEPIGSSILKFEEGFIDDLIKTPISKKLSRSFLYSFPKDIYKVCSNISPKNDSKNSTKDLELLRTKIKENNNFLNFGILRSEIIDSLNDYSLCNLII
jgi:hypothetical protein